MSKINVLLVDDNAVQAKLVQAYLYTATQPQEFEVTYAADWAAGKDQLRNQRFDIILLDLSLPNGAGLSLVRNVMAEARGTTLVIITGSEDDETFFECLAEGVDGFILKSVIRKKDLLRAMWMAMNHSQKRQMEYSSFNIAELEAKLAVLKSGACQQNEKK